MILQLGKERLVGDGLAPRRVADAQTLLRLCLEQHVSLVILPVGEAAEVALLEVRLRQLGIPISRGLPWQARETNLGRPRLCMEAGRLNLVWNGIRVGLTEVQWRLLQALFSQPSAVLSREQLCQQLYRDRRVVSPRSIDSHVRRLRGRLRGQGVSERLIETVPGQGYRYPGLVDGV